MQWQTVILACLQMWKIQVYGGSGKVGMDSVMGRQFFLEEGDGKGLAGTEHHLEAMVVSMAVCKTAGASRLWSTKFAASWLQRPPTSMPSTTSLHGLAASSSGWVRSLLLRAVCRAAPRKVPACLRCCPARVIKRPMLCQRQIGPHPKDSGRSRWLQSSGHRSAGAGRG